MNIFFFTEILSAFVFAKLNGGVLLCPGYVPLLSASKMQQAKSAVSASSCDLVALNAREHKCRTWPICVLQSAKIS